MPDENGHNHEQHGFMFPLTELLHQHHDRDHMAAEELRTTIYSFLDSLTAEQLHGLRRILNLDRNAPMNNYVDGMAVTILRLVHKVDPETGIPPLDHPPVPES